MVDFTIQRDTATLQPAIQKSTNGAAHVALGSIGAASNRELNAVAGTRLSMTWTTPVTQLTITVLREAAAVVSATAAALPASIVCSFDSANDASADANLISTNSASVVSQRIIILENNKTTYRFTTGISRIDFLRYTGAEALTVSVEAIV